MTEQIFCIPGPPKPKERPRVVRVKGRLVTFTPKKSLKYEHLVGMCARSAGVRELEGPVSLDASFYLPTKRRMDLDNLLKAVLDGLNGIAYADDSQVCEVKARRSVDSENPRAVVTVRAA